MNYPANIKNTSQQERLQHDELYLNLDVREYRDTIINLKDAARATGCEVPQEILAHLEEEKAGYLSELRKVRKEMIELGVKRLRMQPRK